MEVLSPSSPEPRPPQAEVTQQGASVSLEDTRLNQLHNLVRGGPSLLLVLNRSRKASWLDLC